MSCFSFISVGFLIFPLLFPFPSLPCFQGVPPPSLFFWFALRSYTSPISVWVRGLSSLFPHQGFKVPSPALCTILWLLLLDLFWRWFCLALSKSSVPFFCFSVALKCPSLSLNLQTCRGVGWSSVGIWFVFLLL